MMNAEPTAEKRPACVPPSSVLGAQPRSQGIKVTHKDERRVQILVVLSSIVLVKFFRFPTIYGIEVSARVVGPQWAEEFLEGRMEATEGSYRRRSCSQRSECKHTILNRAGQLWALEFRLEVETGVEPCCILSDVTNDMETGTDPLPELVCVPTGVSYSLPMTRRTLSGLMEDTVRGGRRAARVCDEPNKRNPPSFCDV